MSSSLATEIDHRHVFSTVISHNNIHRYSILLIEVQLNIRIFLLAASRGGRTFVDAQSINKNKLKHLMQIISSLRNIG